MGNTVYNTSRLKDTRKELRNNSTNYEKLLWKELKGSQFFGLKFRRQHSVGRYILDFYCSSEKIGIELDGFHHLQEDTLEYDTLRTEYLEADEIRILRIMNTELDSNLEDVMGKIKNFIFS